MMTRERLSDEACDISSEVIDEIADKVAFKGIGLKHRLRALLNQYRIAYDANDLEFARNAGEAYSFRSI